MKDSEGRYFSVVYLSVFVENLACDWRRLWILPGLHLALQKYSRG